MPQSYASVQLMFITQFFNLEGNFQFLDGFRSTISGDAWCSGFTYSGCSTAVWTWRVIHLLHLTRLVDAFLICVWFQQTSPNGVLTVYDLDACLLTTLNTMYPGFASFPRARFQEDSLADCEFTKRLWCSFVIVRLGDLFAFRNVLGHYTQHC